MSVMPLFSVCSRSTWLDTCLQEWMSDKTVAHRPITKSSRRDSTSDISGLSKSIQISSWVSSLDIYIRTPSVSSTAMVRFLVLPHSAPTYTYTYLRFFCVDKKNQLDVTFCIFISLLIVAQHVSGNHVPIIRS